MLDEGSGNKLEGELLCVGIKRCCVTDRWEGVITPTFAVPAGRAGWWDVGWRLERWMVARRREMKFSPWCTVRFQIHQNGKSRPQSPVETTADCHFLYIWHIECVCIGSVCEEDDEENWLPSFC